MWPAHLRVFSQMVSVVWKKPPAIEDNITQVIFLWHVLYISQHLSDVVAVKFYCNLTGEWACISII